MRHKPVLLGGIALLWWVLGQLGASFAIQTACPFDGPCTLTVQNNSPAIGHLLAVRVDGRPAQAFGDVPILPGQSTTARLYTAAGVQIRAWETIDYAIGTLPGPYTWHGQFASR